MNRCASHRRRTLPFGLIGLLAVLLAGCSTHRSQLIDPHPASAEAAARAREVLAAHPLPAERQAQVAIEARGRTFVTVAYFAVGGPASYTAELTAPFGVTLIEVRRDEHDAVIISEAGPLKQAMTIGRFPRLLSLWLLGDCAGGEVWEAANAVAVDCPANGPDQGLTWRLWVDPDEGTRPRGELLRGQRLLADFICDAGGYCVLQDPVHDYALRVVPAY